MLSNKRLVATCAFALCCNIVVLFIFVKYNIGEKCYVTISEHQTMNITIPNDFLSIGIDTSEVEGYKVDFDEPKLRKLAAALSPARLRLGGKMSERLIFSKDDISDVSCKNCPNLTNKGICSAVRKICRHKLPFFIMTGKEFSRINEFCKVSQLKLLFSFNVLLRDHNSSEWNSANAIELLQYAKHRGYDIDWQLGNEPNSFYHTFNVSIPPQMLAHDFKKLRNTLNHHGYKNTLLVGPDTTRPQDQRPECLQYMIDFLENGSSFINVRSWHQYYLNSKTAKLEDFWDTKTFELLNKQINSMKKSTSDFNHIPMWLTETSSSYGGGASGLSNTYAGTPLWVDKLGLAARNNITTVVRQSFFGGNYSLVDKNLEPLPDWWVSVLYKKLVGNKVLNVDCQCSGNQRMYAHCASKSYTKDRTAITLFGINLELASIKFLLNGTALHGDNLIIDEYIISAPSNNRKTRTILLNGWPLYFESSLEELQPRHLKYGNHIFMPPYSIGFWVVKNTSIKCS